MMTSQFVLMVMLSCAVHGCVMPPGGFPTDVQNIISAPVVLLGKILRHYETNQQGALYTAEMDVYCILKGQPVPALVNITGAGFDPQYNDCWGAELDVGETYIVSLTSQLRVRAPPVSIENFYRALRACGLNEPTLPIDVLSESAPCPKPLPAGECSPR